VIHKLIVGRVAARAAAVLGALSVAACGSSGAGGSSGDAEVVADLQETEGQEDLGPGCLPSLEALNTGVSQDSVFAGEVVLVTCAFAGCDSSDDYEFGILVGGEAGSDYDATGDSVTFRRPGSYQVACTFTTANGGEWQDQSPATLAVSPGVPERIETALPGPEAKAGDNVPVECHAFDEYDNEVFGQWIIAVQPQAGTTVAGQSLKAKVAGDYKVSCVLDGLHPDESPAPLTVIPNVPVRVYTDLTSPTITAGESSGITCKATDLYDNKVTAFPMVVAVPPQVDLVGLKVTSTIVGFYEVKCVPQAMDWALFKLFPATLTVVPGAPQMIELTLVPEKNIYKVMDKVQILAAARDAHLNLVPDAVFAPIEVVPPEGVGPLANQTFKFLEMGEHDFIVKLLDTPEVSAKAHVVVDGQGPLLSIDTPERGATVDKPAVTVAGTVSDQVTGLASFTINEASIEVQPDHSFSTVVPAGHAVNRIVALAEDAGGETSRTMRSFAYADTWYPGEGDDAETFVPSGMRIFLSENFVDDGDHNHTAPDDLATLMEVVLASLDFGSMIPNPVYDANNYKVFVKNVQFDQPFVQMDMIEGGMTVNSTFKNFTADVDAIGDCKVIFVDLCPDVHGKLKIDELALYASVQLWLEPGQGVQASMTSLELGVSAPELDLEGLAGNLLQPIINAVISLFQSSIEDALKAQVADMLPGVLSDLFAQFELDQNLSLPAFVDGGVPTNLTLQTRYSYFDASPGGIEMHFNTRAWSLKKVTHNPLGSLGRGKCAGPDAPAFVLSEDSEVSVAIGDDMLNQILFAAWWGGALNMSVPQSALESLAGTLSGYGISELSVDLDFFLSPMLSDCNPDKALRFGVGDLYLQAKLKMLGIPITVGAFVMVMGDAEIELVEDGGAATFSLTIDQIGLFDYEVVSVTEGYEDLVPIIDELVQSGVVEGALAGIAGQSFGGIELPEIDLSDAVPGVPAGTKISVHPESLSRVAGFTELEGTMQ